MKWYVWNHSILGFLLSWLFILVIALLDITIEERHILLIGWVLIGSLVFYVLLDVIISFIRFLSRHIRWE